MILNHLTLIIYLHYLLFFGGGSFLCLFVSCPNAPSPLNTSPTPPLAVSQRNKPPLHLGRKEPDSLSPLPQAINIPITAALRRPLHINYPDNLVDGP